MTISRWWPRAVLSSIAMLAFMMALAACSHNALDDHLAAGDQAMRNKQFAKAETEYQAAIRAAPNDPRGHLALGNFYLDERKFDPAELEFMKVLQLDPHNASAHQALGVVYGSQSKLGLAESQFRAAVALAPLRVTYRLSLGNVLAAEGKNPGAEAQFRTATGLEPGNARAHLALAKLLSREPDRRADADAEFAEVRALDPSLIPASVAPVSSPAMSPTSASTAAPARFERPRVRATNRRFLLTRDSPVYQTTNEASQVLAQVHHGKWIHVTGISGNWFRIRMRNGTVGFVPVSVAE
ncbi:MAG: tetratricopeptide repeat protein [Candidatus Binataceae bacterium]